MEFGDSLRAVEYREGLQGIVGIVICGAPMTSEDNIKEWTGLEFGDALRSAEDREGWKGIVATSPVVPPTPHPHPDDLRGYGTVIR